MEQWRLFPANFRVMQTLPEKIIEIEFQGNKKINIVFKFIFTQFSLEHFCQPPLFQKSIYYAVHFRDFFLLGRYL